MKADKKPVRSALPKTALPRIIFIDREIASGEYPSSAEMAKKYETSLATIGRDIAFMKDSLNAPIEYSARRRGFFYTMPNYRIPAGFSGAENLLALGMAKNILSLYRNTPFYEAVHNLLESITASLSVDENDNWYEKRVVVPPVPSAPVAPEIWNPITQGLQKNQILTFDYKGTWDEEYKPRRVRPYQLLFDTGVWYLYGYAEERKAVRVFSLPRMKNVTLSNVHFSLPKRFDYRSNNSGSFFGVFAGQEKFQFRIVFYDESVLWVQERQWAEDQKIEKTHDGVVITFTSTQYDKVLEWILSRGCTALPLAPKTLVNDWRYHAAEMGKLAKNEKERRSNLIAKGVKY